MNTNKKLNRMFGSMLIIFGLAVVYLITLGSQPIPVDAITNNPDNELTNGRFVNGTTNTTNINTGSGSSFSDDWVTKQGGSSTGTATLKKVSNTRGATKLTISNSGANAYYYLRQTIPNLTQHSQKTYTAVVDVQSVSTNQNESLNFDFYINARWNDNGNGNGSGCNGGTPTETTSRICLFDTNQLESPLTNRVITFEFTVPDLSSYSSNTTDSSEGLEFAFRIHSPSVNTGAEVVINSISLYEGSGTSWRTHNSNGLMENTPKNSDRLSPGAELHPGEYILSPDGSFGLLFQGDRNIVLMGGEENKVFWAMGTNGTGATKLKMQDGDGNLVTYKPGAAVWATSWSNSGGTTPGPGYNFLKGVDYKDSYFRVQNDGNLVVYSEYNAWLWQSGSSGNAVSGTNVHGDRLEAGESLLMGEYILEPNGKNKLKLNSNGELAVYGPGNIKLWSTGTTEGESLHMLSNGILELRDTNGNTIWSSNTDGQSSTVAGSWVRVQDDGNVVIYTPSPGSSAVWATSTNY